jgi:hypothetical protein
MRTTRRVQVAGFLLMALGCVVPAMGGGERTNIQGMGMARTFVAVSQGLDAVGLNPANLDAGDNGTITIGLMPLGMHVGTDFMNYGLYNEYFTGVESGNGREPRYLTDADKQAILSAFTGDLGRASAHLEVRLLGLSVGLPNLGRAALTVTDYVSANALIPRDYAEFMLYGNTPGSAYEFGEATGYATWLREYALTYAITVPVLSPVRSVSAGVSVKLVHGFGHAEIDRFNTRLLTGADGVLDGSLDVHGRMSGSEPFSGSDGAKFQMFPAPAGTGFGLDLGFAMDVNEYLRAGMSVTDIGSVVWTGNVEEFVTSGTIHLDNPLDEAQRDSVENAVIGESRPGESFTTSLPTALRLGASVELNKIPGLKHLFYGGWTFACDYNYGLVESAGSAAAGRLSMGLEFRPWRFLPLRTGVSFGGPDHFNFALGFGLHFGVFAFDIASEHVNYLLSEDSFAHGSVAMGMRIKI